VRIVVKVGSSSLVGKDGRIRIDAIARLVTDAASAIDDGHHIVVVSSGAIATGLGTLGKTQRPKELPALQAASAVGQGHLFSLWGSLFRERTKNAAQVLLTMHDVAHRSSYLNARNTLEQLLEWGCVPIVNENDTTATDEITFGDNDTLAAQVAVLLNADMLILLTDTDGLYTAHPDEPGAELISRVDDHSLLHRIDTAQPGSHWGSGGMRSKVIAAEMASVGGTTTYIANSAAENVIVRLALGESLGTCVAADSRKGSSFKLWLRYAKHAQGEIEVDEGACRAIAERGASLLPVGITGVVGSFKSGDAVTVRCGEHGEVAKGIAEYSSGDLAKLADDPDRARGMNEAIHRDQLVVYASVAPGA
jgi:glutamate 5-kinase